jgi:hypothetical protein
MELATFLAGLIGVLLGALLATLGFFLSTRFEHRRDLRRRELEHKVKEIETLNLLNKKISEMLQKRTLLMPEFVSFDAFDDVHISIDDYSYLQSFAAQNNFYLPSYVMEEFFKRISHRRVVLSPEETVQIGGYTFKGGRGVMESFSDELQKLMDERKTQLKQLNQAPLHLLLKDENEIHY